MPNLRETKEILWVAHLLGTSQQEPVPEPDCDNVKEKDTSDVSQERPLPQDRPVAEETTPETGAEERQSNNVKTTLDNNHIGGSQQRVGKASVNPKLASTPVKPSLEWARLLRQCIQLSTDEEHLTLNIDETVQLSAQLRDIFPVLEPTLESETSLLILEDCNDSMLPFRTMGQEIYDAATQYVDFSRIWLHKFGKEPSFSESTDHSSQGDELNLKQVIPFIPNPRKCLVLIISDGLSGFMWNPKVQQALSSLPSGVSIVWVHPWHDSQWSLTSVTDLQRIHPSPKDATSLINAQIVSLENEDLNKIIPFLKGQQLHWTDGVQFYLPSFMEDESVEESESEMDSDEDFQIDELDIYNSVMSFASRGTKRLLGIIACFPDGQIDYALLLHLADAVMEGQFSRTDLAMTLHSGALIKDAEKSSHTNIVFQYRNDKTRRLFLTELPTALIRKTLTALLEFGTKQENRNHLDNLGLSLWFDLHNNGTEDTSSEWRNLSDEALSGYIQMTKLLKWQEELDFLEKVKHQRTQIGVPKTKTSTDSGTGELGSSADAASVATHPPKEPNETQLIPAIQDGISSQQLPREMTVLFLTLLHAMGSGIQPTTVSKFSEYLIETRGFTESSLRVVLHNLLEIQALKLETGSYIELNNYALSNNKHLQKLSQFSGTYYTAPHPEVFEHILINIGANEEERQTILKNTYQTIFEWLSSYTSTPNGIDGLLIAASLHQMAISFGLQDYVEKTLQTFSISMQMDIGLIAVSLSSYVTDNEDTNAILPVVEQEALLSKLWKNPSCYGVWQRKKHTFEEDLLQSLAFEFTHLQPAYRKKAGLSKLIAKLNSYIDKSYDPKSGIPCAYIYDNTHVFTAWKQQTKMQGQISSEHLDIIKHLMLLLEGCDEASILIGMMLSWGHYEVNHIISPDLASQLCTLPVPELHETAYEVLKREVIGPRSPEFSTLTQRLYPLLWPTKLEEIFKNKPNLLSIGYIKHCDAERGNRHQIPWGPINTARNTGDMDFNREHFEHLTTPKTHICPVVSTHTWSSKNRVDYCPQCNKTWHAWLNWAIGSIPHTDAGFGTGLTKSELYKAYWYPSRSDREVEPSETIRTLFNGVVEGLELLVCSIAVHSLNSEFFAEQVEHLKSASSMVKMHIVDFFVEMCLIVEPQPFLTKLLQLVKEDINRLKRLRNNLAHAGAATIENTIQVIEGLQFYQLPTLTHTKSLLYRNWTDYPPHSTDPLQHSLPHGLILTDAEEQFYLELVGFPSTAKSIIEHIEKYPPVFGKKPTAKTATATSLYSAEEPLTIPDTIDQIPVESFEITDTNGKKHNFNLTKDIQDRMEQRGITIEMLTTLLEQGQCIEGKNVHVYCILSERWTGIRGTTDPNIQHLKVMVEPENRTIVTVYRNAKLNLKEAFAKTSIEQLQQIEKRKEALKELRHFAMWNNQAGDKKWEEKYRIFIEHGGTEETARQTKLDAQEILRELEPIKKDILDNPGKYSKKHLPEDGRRLMKKFGPYANTIQKSLLWAIRRSEVDRKTDTISPTQNTPIHKLKPHPHWVLLIDESGSQFSAEHARDACFVGILAPKDSDVEPLEFSIEPTIESKVNILEVLTAQKDWSIIGLRPDAFANTGTDSWLSGVLEIVRWVLRLLPIDRPTTLEVNIEQRAPYMAGETTTMGKLLLQQELLTIAPERMANINLQLEFVRKYSSSQIEAGNLDETLTHKWLAYADLVAYMWNSKDRVYKQLMERTQLCDRFLHSAIKPNHRLLLDQILKRNPISGVQWTEFLNETRIQISSLLYAVSEELKSFTKTSSEQQRILLNEVKRSLLNNSSGGRSTFALQTQATWIASLEEFITETISPQVKLVLSYGRLIRNSKSTHTIDILDLNEYKKSCLQLQQLTPPLANLDLNVSAHLIQSFQFTEAERLIKRWDNVSVPNHLTGRVLSTKGQLKAFKGQHEEALILFEKAIESFNALEDPKERDSNIRHTLCYKIITLIDTLETHNADIESEILKLFPTATTLEHVCTILLRHDEQDQYIHHLFIRYLYFRGPTLLIKQYLQEINSWKHRPYHPWDWITVYRNLLLLENNVMQDSTAFEQELLTPGLRGVTGAIYIAQIYIIWKHFESWNSADVPKSLVEDFFNRFKKNSPGLATFHTAMEEILATEPDDPRVWLPKVLPFSFH